MGLTGALRGSRWEAGMRSQCPCTLIKSDAGYYTTQSKGGQESGTRGFPRRHREPSGQRGAPSDLSVSSPRVSFVGTSFRSCWPSVTLDRTSARTVRRPLGLAPCWLRRPTRFGVPNDSLDSAPRVSPLRRLPPLRPENLPDLSGQERIYSAQRRVSIPDS